MEPIYQDVPRRDSATIYTHDGFSCLLNIASATLHVDVFAPILPPSLFLYRTDDSSRKHRDDKATRYLFFVDKSFQILFCFLFLVSQSCPAFHTKSKWNHNMAFPTGRFQWRLELWKLYDHRYSSSIIPVEILSNLRNKIEQSANLNIVAATSVVRQDIEIVTDSVFLFRCHQRFIRKQADHQPDPPRKALVACRTWKFLFAVFKCIRNDFRHVQLPEGE